MNGTRRVVEDDADNRLLLQAILEESYALTRSNGMERTLSKAWSATCQD